MPRIPTLLARCCLLLLLAGCSAAPARVATRAGGQGTRVLFLGNSYTYVNDLPGTFAGLAASGGHAVETGMSAPGGERFAGHAASPRTAELLRASRWDFVVLQEQSQVPAYASERYVQMYPGARRLAALVRGSGARPVFLLTWAHRGGWPEVGFQDYAAMQDAIDEGYMGIATELKASVAPVGIAWRSVRKEQPGLELWLPDGSHPSVAGTYLAACVLFATLYRESPDGLKFNAGLSPDDARVPQGAATATVLPNSARWRLAAAR